MLTKRIANYYENTCFFDCASNRSQVMEALKRAKPKIGKALAEDIERCVFHDKYILGIHLYADQDTKNCRIEKKETAFRQQ